MQKQYVTIKLLEADYQKLIKHYRSFQQENKGAYISFFAIYHHITISVYFSSKNKGHYKVIFAGQDALEEAKKWSTSFEIKGENHKKKALDKLEFLTYDSQYGSDEVGFGDFFGPLVVVSCFLNQKIYQELNDFILTDSKKLSDDYILKTGALLTLRVKHRVNIVDNEKFNELTKKGYNMNKIKAMLHLNVLTLLKNEVASDAPAYIDQFCSYPKFREYTDGMRMIEPLVMKEKGELLYPSVALASMLARYYFLLEMNKLNNRFATIIPLGASIKVDEFAAEFIKKHGKSALDKIVKQNFINYRRLVT